MERLIGSLLPMGVHVRSVEVLLEFLTLMFVGLMIGKNISKSFFFLRKVLRNFLPVDVTTLCKYVSLEAVVCAAIFIIMNL